MANRRKSSERGERESPKAEAAAKAARPRRGVQHEALAVILGCFGALTVLALISYDARDASLNASGSAQVRNWIGPAGAYWADLLLQALGIGAFALGLGSLLASWRSLTGRRVTPGLREAAGTLLLVVCSGALAHLVLASSNRAYPAGGVLGAILAQLLREQFAVVGAYILATALVLLALALTADGILAGLGLRGLVVLGEVGSRVHALVERWRERRRRLAEMRAALACEGAEPASAEAEQAESWAWDEHVAELEAKLEERRAVRKKRVEEARAQGQAEAEAQAKREQETAKRRARRKTAEPEVTVDAAIDLPAEEAFEMGALPSVATPAEPPPVEASAQPEELAPPAIRAAAPPGVSEAEPLVPPPPPPEALAEAKPKTLVRSRKAKSNEPEIVDVRPSVDVEAIERAAQEPVVPDTPKEFELPPPSLLDYEAAVRAPLDPERLRENAQKLVKTLKEYGIEGSVREIRPGPVVTMYEYVPAPGIKLSKIAGLADDLAMSMSALRVRIVAPIPGKGAVGIEIPNDDRETVYLKEIIAHDAFRKSKPRLTMALGKDIEGNPFAANLAKMPHLLVAGATGTGKSVSVNAMIMSILFKATPDEVRLIMVDPKMLELSVYDGIPHLLLPVVTDPKKASLALRWAVEEMERRYQLLSECGVRSIDGYNEKVAKLEEQGKKLTLPAKQEGEDERVCESMPYIVVIVDELADLMMVASREVEASIMRLAQMARAAGIHLILATQRPSVDVLTGVIKANFPTRIAFQVASKHDSRTIIDANGAEHLLGRGDMLFLSPGVGGIKRVHGAFVSDEEVERTVSFLKAQGKPQYDESILAPRDDAPADGEGGEDEVKDEMYDQAVAIVAETRQASISMIQRRLRIGYNRAARLVERMETEGIVGPADGAKPREVLVNAAM